MAVTELAQRQDFGRLALTHQDERSSVAVGVFVALVTWAGLLFLASAGDCLAAVIAYVIVLNLVFVVLAVAGFRRAQSVLSHRYPTLYIFQRGVVLREGDGRMHAYPWSQVRATVDRTQDMIPWGTGSRFLDLSGSEGRRLGKVIDDEKRQVVGDLMDP